MTHPHQLPFRQDIYHANMRILIAGDAPVEFVDLLQKHLKKPHTQIAITTALPTTLEGYNLYILLNPIDFSPHLLSETQELCVCIFFKHDDIAQMFSTYVYSQEATHIKIINLDSSMQWYGKDAETIMWFIFTSHDDVFLHLYHPLSPQHPRAFFPIHKKKAPISRFLRTPAGIGLIALTLFTIFHTLFIPPLLLASFLNYRSLKNYAEQKPLIISQSAQISLNIAQYLFQMAEPVLRLVNIIRPFEDILVLNQAGIRTAKNIESIRSNARLLMSTLSTPSHAYDEDIVRNMKQQLFIDIKMILRDTQTISTRIPSLTPGKEQLQKKLQTFIDLAPQILEWEPLLDSLLAADGKKRYLLLFANNMELRPGGGFIGSFAIADMEKYQLKSLKTYDVYDADGQLTEHIDPPQPIARYLNQPHWYLRDSAFSPDFVVNAQKAREMLAREINISDINGTILLTTTAVQRILRATGPVYVPDYQEMVTADNFYLKTQLYAEKDFFPGSLQKKSFLTALSSQVLINLDSLSIPLLVEALSRSFDEKHLVILVDDQAAQEAFEKKYWSGRLLRPDCQISADAACIVDYLFPVDANLGVNKANFFMNRPAQLEITIDEAGTIRNTFSLFYQNKSKGELFPGGTYKNYFQLLLAPQVTVETVTVDDELIEEFTEHDDLYKTIGTYFEVLPGETKKIAVTYTLPTTLLAGKGVYQLMFQKQIGASTEELALHINLPDNLIVTAGEFSPLVKGKKIDYNTSISSDKIIVIEFQKDEI